MVVHLNMMAISAWNLAEEDDVITKLGLDSSNPSDDMWRKFSLPLTPPCSPRSFGESSDCEEVMDGCDLDRLQDMSESLDSTYDISPHGCSRVDVLHSKLISDCMWSGNHNDTDRTKRCPSLSVKSAMSKKIWIETGESLYPTPCPSPPPNGVETVEYPSSNECVDPTSVFPFSPINDNSASSHSDTEEEIDVVTVDTKPLRIETGVKRKMIHSLGKKTSSTVKTQVPPSIRRTKSSPAKLARSVPSSRKSCSSNGSASTDDSDPDTKRANHNVLERQRRVDLKKSFELLRDCVPNIESNGKAPKVTVLKKAAEYILKLSREEQDLILKKRVLQYENDRLQQHLQQYLEGE